MTGRGRRTLDPTPYIREATPRARRARRQLDTRRLLRWSAGLALALVLLIACLIVLGYAALLRDNEARHARAYLRSIDEAMRAYAALNSGYFPPAERWQARLLDTGVTIVEVVRSPVHDGNGVSYVYLYTPGLRVDDDGHDRILIYEDPAHYRDGVATLFADGHVAFVPHAEFDRRLARQQTDQAQTDQPQADQQGTTP